jgi:hypothetical protein
LFRALSSRIKLYVGRRGPRVSVFSYEQGSRFAMSAQSTLRHRFTSQKGKGQPSLLEFGIGKVGEEGRVPLPESHTFSEFSKHSEPAAQKPKRGPGRPRKEGASSEAADAKALMKRQKTEALNKYVEEQTGLQQKKAGMYAKYTDQHKLIITATHNELGTDPRASAAYIYEHCRGHLPEGITKEAIRCRIKVISISACLGVESSNCKALMGLLHAHRCACRDCGGHL